MTACDRTIRADLHLHTTASDGEKTPGEMIRAAAAQGITLAAISDHDTVAGVREGMEAGRAEGIQVLPCIELSTGKGQEIHLLGYGIRLDDAALDQFLRTQLARRQERMLAMLDRLRAVGIDIALADVRRQDDGFYGRVDLAQALIARGYATSIREAFDKYLKPGKQAYVPRERVSVQEGIRALAAFGAAPVLAHPGRSGLDRGALGALLPEWMEAGLQGLEVYHPSHDEAVRHMLDHTARAQGLLVTGGSDSHGRQAGPAIGDHLGGWRRMQGDAQALLSRMGWKEQDQ